ncbi:hypothetical protein LINPERHAP1_LOCUS7086 [Linum perenne]
MIMSVGFRDGSSVRYRITIIHLPPYGFEFGCFDNYDTGNINGCSTKGTHRDKTIVGTELDSLQSLLTKLPEKQQVQLLISRVQPRF